MQIHHVSVRKNLSCPACSFQNEAVSLYCRGCFRLLLGHVQGNPPSELWERFVVLADVCEQVRGGRMNEKQFHLWLQTFTSEQKMRELNILALEIPYGLDEDFADELEVGFSGVEACNRGLAILAQEGVTLSYRLLDGLYVFWRGICMVKEAMQINRRNASREIWG